MGSVVLITGAAGFIGSRLAERLAQAGHAIIASDRAFPDGTAPPPQVERRVLDVTERAAAWQLLDATHPTLVIHLAAVLSGGAEVDPSRAFDVNVVGTFNVLEGCRRSGVSHLLLASSCAVYDAPQPIAPCEEATTLAPLGMYGMTKASLEDWGAFYQRRHGLDVRVVRPAGLVGPGRDAGAATSNWTTALIQEPLAGRPYRCPVGEDDALPIVYHTDFLDGLVAMCRLAPLPSTIYNLGACRVTAGDLAALVRARIPAAQIEFQPSPVARFVVGRLRHLDMDSSRASRELGYTPRHDTPAKMVDAFISEVSPR